MNRLVTGAALALICEMGSAWASPSFCTGTTTVVTSGTFVSGSSLVGTGNCIEASDKIFGGFTVSGAITGGGSAGWLFTMTSGPADVTIGFQGLVGSNMTGSVNYDVAVDPTNSNGALISQLEKDFTFNSLGIGSTATLTGNITPTPDIGSFSCTRDGNVPPDTCPQFGSFSPLTDMLAINETITTGPNTNVTALTDTVFQAIPSVPEPASLGILSASLLLLATFGIRKAR